MAAPVADTLSPDQLSALIQVPPDPDPLPRYDPNAGHDPKAATPEDVEKMLADLPQANKADTVSDDPNAALVANLRALQSELQTTIDGQEKIAAASPGEREYVFESDDLNLYLVVRLKDKTTYMMQFASVPIVRRGKLTKRGVWRSSSLSEDMADRAVEIVETLRKIDDFRFGRIRERESADAEDIAGEIGRLRGALARRSGEAPSQTGPQDRNFDDALRSVPNIARTMQLPAHRG